MTTRWRSIDTRLCAMPWSGAVICVFVDGFATCEGASTLASLMLLCRMKGHRLITTRYAILGFVVLPRAPSSCLKTPQYAAIRQSTMEVTCCTR